MTAKTHQIQVRLGFDAEGFEAAVKEYLTDLVESGTAKYDRATYDLIIARAEEMVGDFVKTETFSVEFNG